MSETNNLQEEIEELVDIDDSTYSLMNEFLMNQPKDIQRRVRETVRIWGISEQDPYFLILIQCRITQILYELTPNEIQKAFDHGMQELTQVFEQFNEKLFKQLKEEIDKQQKAALNISLAKVNLAIAKVMEDNNISYKNRQFSPRVMGSMVTAASMLLTAFVCFIGGMTFDSTALAKNRQAEADLREQSLISWAKSDEGKLAKRIVEWNEDLIGGECQKKVESLGITFQMGSAKATSGFCVVFVEPPERRKFITSEN